MRGMSHVIIGGCALLSLGQRPALSLPFVMAVGINIIGSLLPDVDSDESTIRHSTGTARSQGLAGRLVSAVMPGHRGIIHSPLLALAVLAICWWQGSALALAFATGWCSHISVDKLTGLIGAKNGGLIEVALVIGAVILTWKIMT